MNTKACTNPEKTDRIRNGIGMRNCVNAARLMMTATITFPAKMFPNNRHESEITFAISPMMFNTPMNTSIKPLNTAPGVLAISNGLILMKFERCLIGEIFNARIFAIPKIMIASASGCDRSDVDCRNTSFPS